MDRRKFLHRGAMGTAIVSVPQFSLAHSPPAFELTDRIRTPVCDLLKIDYPIIQAGMADVAGPELVAAVSNAGGLGILTATMVPPDLLRQRIHQIRERTDRPFGVNLILHQDLFPPAEFDIEDGMVQQVQKTLNGFRRELGIPESYNTPQKLPPLIQMALDIILEERIPVFSVGLGKPSREMIAKCRDRGIKVMVMVSTVEDALVVAANNPDIIVAQGSEAGGHRSTWEKKQSKEYASIGTLPLTAAVTQKLDLPVVAAGGIVNGRGLKAALAVGAQAVLMGTRFIATNESMAPESYKRRLLESSSDDTTITDIFTGMYARVLRNRFTETYSELNTPVLPPGRQYAATVDIVKEAGKRNMAELYTLYSGQGIDGIQDIKPAAEVVRDIVAEAVTE